MAVNRWTVRVKKYNANGTIELLGYVPFVELMYSIELNGPGAGSVTFDLDSDFLEYGDLYTELTEHENVWEMLFDGYVVAQFLSQKFDLTYVSSDLQRTAVVSGPGLLDAFKRIEVFPQAYPTASGTSFPRNFGDASSSINANTLHNNLYWKLSNMGAATRMEAWHKIWANSLARQGVTRSPIRFVDLAFDEDYDSDGVGWAEAIAGTEADTVVALGTKLDALLIDSVEKSYGDFYVRPYQDGDSGADTSFAQLVASQDLGIDKSDSVAFFDSLLFSKRRLFDLSDTENVISYLEKYGTSTELVAVLHQATRQDMIDSYGRRENWLADDELTNDMSYDAEKVSYHRAVNYAEPITSWTVEVPPFVMVTDSYGFDDPVDHTLFRAGVDYSVGDYIGVVGEGDRRLPRAMVPLRVQALSGRVDSSGIYTVELTLESQSQLTRRLPVGEKRRLISFAGMYEQHRTPDVTPIEGLTSASIVTTVFADLSATVADVEGYLTTTIGNTSLTPSDSLYPSDTLYPS